MKKTSVTLAIPTPCRENWQGMTPAEQGRFCQSCQKTVVDFTQKTDREVARFFEAANVNNQPKGHTCGRFRADQLNRPLRALPPTGFGTRLRALGLVVPGLLLGGWAEAQSQRQVLGKVAAPRPAAAAQQSGHGGENQQRPLPGKILIGDVAPAAVLRTISGTVTDAETGEALIGASILLKGTDTGTISDVDGSYALQLPEGVENPILEFTYVGYLPVEMTLAPGQTAANAALAYGPAVLGEMGVVGTLHFSGDETLYRIVRRKIGHWAYQVSEHFQGRRIAKQNKIQDVPKQAEDLAAVPLEATLPPLAQPSPAQAEALKAEAFPNPYGQHLSLRFDSPAEERLTIRLLDMNGTVVLEQLYGAAKGEQVLELRSAAGQVPAGHYILEVSNGGELRHAGLVVKI